MSHRRACAVLGWLALLAGSATVLLRAGDVLPTPPIDPLGWREWARPLGPAVTAASVGRVAALGALAYVTFAVLAQVGARTARLRRTTRLLDVLTIPVVRRAIVGVTAVGLTAPNAVPVAAAAHDPLGRVAAVARPREVATMVRLDDLAEPSPVTHPVATPSPPPVPATAATHTIRPGDHLWGIARDTLAARWGRPPTDAEVSRYHHAVIDENRSVLVVADQPDLVLPGQVFALPPVSAAGPPPRSPAAGHGW